MAAKAALKDVGRAYDVPLERVNAITKHVPARLHATLDDALAESPEFKREYLHLAHKKCKAVAKVAAARKLAVRLYWMLRTNVAYPAIASIERSSRVPLVGSMPDR